MSPYKCISFSSHKIADLPQVKKNSGKKTPIFGNEETNKQNVFSLASCLV